MQPQSTESAGKIGVINGLRGVAIIGVVYGHLYGVHIDASDHTVTLGWFKFYGASLLTNGMHGVTLFFILSGFALTLPYFQNRRTMQSFADARAFYARRLRRLGPLYALCVLFCLTFIYPHEFYYWVPMMFTMAFSFNPNTFFPHFNPVLWTLAVEAAFSVVLPLVLIGVRRFGAKKMFLSALVFCFLMRFFSAANNWSETVGNGLLGRFDDFMTGVFLAYLFFHHRHTRIPYGLLIGLLFLVVGFQCSDFSFVVSVHHLQHLSSVRNVVHPLMYLLVELGCFFCIDALLRGRHRFAVWLMENPLLQMVGLMSYSLYVWHYIMLEPLKATLDAVHLVRYLIMLGLLSLVSYRFIEFGHVASIRKLLPSPRTVRFPLASWFRTSETSGTHPL